MVNTLQDAAAVIGKDCLGFNNKDIRTHLLCSSVGMSMYLGECQVYTIMMIGRWSSNTFLLYIRKQVKQFSLNVANKMLMYKTYNHIPDYELTLSSLDPCFCNHANNAETCWNVCGNMAAQAWLPAFMLHY